MDGTAERRGEERKGGPGPKTGRPLTLNKERDSRNKAEGWEKNQTHTWGRGGKKGVINSVHG